MSLISAQQIKTVIPTADQQIYVSKGGNDTINDGSILRPFLTVGKALASLTPGHALTSILVAPGTYTEAIALKPNALIVAESFGDVVLSGAVSLDASWSGTDSQSSGFSNIDLASPSPISFDFTTGAGATNVTLYLLESFLSAPLTVNVKDNNTLVQAFETKFAAAVTLLGAIADFYNDNFVGAGSAVLTVSNNANSAAFLEAVGGGTDSPVNFTRVNIGGANGITAKLIGFAIAAAMTVTEAAGVSPVISATVEAFNGTAGPVLVGGAATPTLLTFSPGLGYIPTTPANWLAFTAVAPINAQQAFDDLAASAALATTGLSWKNPVQTIAATPIALTGFPVIAGFQTAAGTRVLVNGQASSIANGIYVAAAGAWTRAADLPVGSNGLGAAMFVEGVDALNNPSSFQGQQWVQNDAPAVVGTNNLNFVQFGAMAASNQPTGNDKDLTPAAVSGAIGSTTLAISATSKGYVLVLVNGAGQRVGNGVKTLDCFWSSDGGVTALPSTNVPAGAVLYWNPVPATGGFALQTSDVIDFDYNV